MWAHMKLRTFWYKVIALYRIESSSELTAASLTKTGLQQVSTWSGCVETHLDPSLEEEVLTVATCQGVHPCPHQVEE